MNNKGENNVGPEGCPNLNMPQELILKKCYVMALSLA